jgi:RNA-directed DNA polymerase
MRREFHVRFCEGPGGKFLRATRPVLCFEQEEDARRVMSVLPERLGRFGLTLHPEKTRLLDFRRPQRSAQPSNTGRPQRPGSFDMLGFTHFWGRSRKGIPIVQRKTSSSRFSRALKRVTLWCRQHRHDQIADQREKLATKLRGHYAYYGITGNGRALVRFQHGVCLTWWRWLNRRSDRHHMPWSHFMQLLQRHPLPPVVVVHSIYHAVASP